MSSSNEKKSNLKKPRDESEAGETSNDASASSKKKRVTGSGTPQILSSVTPIKKKKVTIDGVDSGVDSEEGEVEEEDESETHKESEEKAENSVKFKKAKRVAVLQTKDVVELNELTHNKIKLFQKYQKSVNQTDEVSERHKRIDVDLHPAIDMVLTTKFPDLVLDWPDWSDDDFFERLLSAVPDESMSGAIPGGVSVRDRLLNTRVTITPWNAQKIIDLQQSITQLLKLMDKTELTPKVEEALVAKYIDEYNKVDNTNKAKKRCFSVVCETGKPKTFKDMLQKMHKSITEMTKTCQTAYAVGMYDPSLPEHRDHLKALLLKDHKPSAPIIPRKQNANPAPATGAGAAKPATGGCKACGRAHAGDCVLRDHPDRNWSNTVSWADSRQGQAWAAQGETTLPYGRLLNGTPFTSKHSRPTKKGECRFLTATTSVVCNDSINNNSDFVPCTIFSIQGNTMMVDGFVDNGALGEDYISRETAEWLTSQGHKVCSCNKRVCSGFRNMCSNSLGKVSFTLSFVNEITKSEEKIDLTAAVIESPFDIIIGRPTIKLHNLASKLHSQFSSGVINSGSLHGVNHSNVECESNPLCYAFHIH